MLLCKLNHYVLPRIFRRKNAEHSLILFIVIYISKFPDICFIRKTVSIIAAVFSNYFSNVTFSHLRYGRKMACNLNNNHQAGNK